MWAAATLLSCCYWTHMSDFFHRISRHTRGKILYFVMLSVLIVIVSGSVILIITLSLVYYILYLINLPTFSLLTFVLTLDIYIHADIPRLMVFHR